MRVQSTAAHAIETLWSDATGIAVNKPAGLLVHNSAFAGPREDVTLVSLVRAQHGAQLHPVHRLDRGTSGVVLFATEPHVAAWQAALADGAARKRYWALVRGHVDREQAIDHPIVDDEGNASDAHSIVRPLLSSTVDRCALVEVELLTGRQHQARRHLKHISHPVLGDATHGKGPLNRAFRERYGLSRLALHARSVELTVPGTTSRLVICAPVPDDLKAPLAQLFAPTALAALVTGVAEH